MEMQSGTDLHDPGVFLGLWVLETLRDIRRLRIYRPLSPIIPWGARKFWGMATPYGYFCPLALGYPSPSTQLYLKVNA